MKKLPAPAQYPLSSKATVEELINQLTKLGLKTPVHFREGNRSLFPECLECHFTDSTPSEPVALFWLQTPKSDNEQP